jgi:hypothetical protein
LQRSFCLEHNPLLKVATNLSFHAAQLANNPLPLKLHRARTSEHCEDVQQAAAGSGASMSIEFRQAVNRDFSGGSRFCSRTFAFV